MSWTEIEDYWRQEARKMSTFKLHACLVLTLIPTLFYALVRNADIWEEELGRRKKQKEKP